MTQILALAHIRKASALPDDVTPPFLPGMKAGVP
jgi:hypothetical protein